MKPVLHLALERFGKEFAHESVIIAVEGHDTLVVHQVSARSLSPLNKVKRARLNFCGGSVYFILSVNGGLLMLATSLRRASSLVSMCWNPRSCSAMSLRTSSWIFAW